MVKRRDFGKLLELGDGKPRGPITGRKDHRLPSWERLLEIDAAAEQAAAEARRAIAGPDVARGERGVVEATSDTPGGSGPQTKLDGRT